MQSAHFSRRQHTLHDALIRALSDDTNHDNVMTVHILNEIIVNYPKTIETGHLVLRSDNCSMQFKSRFVFKSLLDIAQKYNIQITWFMVKLVMAVV